MIEVREGEDNSFTIHWDEKCPKERLLNDWKEEDFITAIKKYLSEND